MENFTIGNPTYLELFDSTCFSNSVKIANYISKVNEWVTSWHLDH